MTTIPQRIKMRFERSAPTYDAHAWMQRRAAQRLSTLLAEYQEQYPPAKNIFEIGAGTGIFTRLLLENIQHPENLYLNDLIESHALSYHGSGGIPCMGDATKIQLPKDLDLIVSSSCLQWISPLAPFVGKLSAHLKEGGRLAFSTYGPQNFIQIRQSAGMGLEYLGVESLEDILSSSGFKDIQICEDFETMYFETARDILGYFSKTGVNGNHSGNWSRAHYTDFVRRYEDLRVADQGLPLTIHYIWVLASKGSCQ